MKKIITKAKWLLIAAALLYAGFLALVVAVVDANEVDDALKAAVTQVTGRQVVLPNSGNVTLFPLPHYSLPELSISNVRDGRAEHFIQLKHLNIPLGPFSGADISNLSIDTATISVERVNGLKPNYRLEPDEESIALVNQEFAIKIAQLEMQYIGDTRLKDAISVSLRDATLSAENAQSGLTLAGNVDVAGESSDASVTLANYVASQEPIGLIATLKNSNLDLTFDAAMAKSFGGEEALTGTLKATHSLQGDEQNAQSTSLMDVVDVMAGAGKVVLETELSINQSRIEANKLSFKHPMLNVAGRINYKLGSDEPIRVLIEKARGSFGTLNLPTIRQLKELSLSPALMASRVSLGISSLEFDTANNNKVVAHGSMQFSPQGAYIKKLQIAGLPGSSSVALEGHFQENKMDAQIALAGNKFSPFISWLTGEEITISDSRSHTFSYVSQIKLTNQQLELTKISALLNKSDVSGIFSYDFGKSRTIDAQLKSKRLNLDRLRGKSKPKGMVTRTDYYKQFDNLRVLDRYLNLVTVSFESEEVIYRGQTMSNLATSVSVRPGELSLNGLRLELPDKGAVSGELVLNAKALTPNLNGTFNIDYLDSAFLQSFMIGSDEALSDAEREAKKQRRNYTPKWSEARLDIAELGMYEGVFKVNIRRFVHDRIDIQNVKMQAILRDEQIFVTDIRALVFDGEMTGKALVGLRPPSANVTLALPNAKMYAFFNQLFGFKAVLDGRMGISGRVTMSGPNISEWINSMQGELDITGRGAVVNGVNFRLLAQKVPAQKGIREVRFWTHRALTGGQSAIDYFSGKATIRHGQMSIENLSLTHSLFEKAVISGALDLPNWAINMRGDFWIDVLGTLPVAVTITGDMEKPFVYWDNTQVEKYWERGFFGF